MTSMLRWFGFTVALLGMVGCVGMDGRSRVEVPPSAKPVEGHIIWSQTTWSGDVQVVRPLIVTKTGSLTLQPGTRVFFDIPEVAAGKDREPWILVLGSMVALGSEERPITFTSVEPRQNELDDMIHLQGAKEAHFRNCEFSNGPWALHIHDTPVDVIDSVFVGNYGGLRFQGERVLVQGNRFQDNRIGLRCLKTSPRIEGNTFSGNLTGLFFREGVSGAVVRNNNFDNTEYDLKLGETQTADVDAGGNWWQAAEAGKLDERIYDGQDGAGMGMVVSEPTLAAPWGSAKP